MVKSAQDRSYSNLTKSLNGTTGRGILAKCQMCPDVGVVSLADFARQSPEGVEGLYGLEPKAHGLERSRNLVD